MTVITTKAISSSIVVAMIRLRAHKNRDRHAWNASAVPSAEQSAGELTVRCIEYRSPGKFSLCGNGPFRQLIFNVLGDPVAAIRLPPASRGKADMTFCGAHVGFLPKADTGGLSSEFRATRLPGLH
jgi:hypothetical protein